MGDDVVVFFEYVIGHGMAQYSAQSWLVYPACFGNLRIRSFSFKRLGNIKLADSLKANKIDVLRHSKSQSCCCCFCCCY